MAEVEIGTISDFFARPVVAAVELSGELSTGDRIHIKGHTTDIEVDVVSIQIHNQEVTSAHSGDAVGIKVSDKVRHGDKVFKIIN
jgi:translation elongation factor EF-1alpha